MQNLHSKNFGLIMAFLLPGFISLWGVSYHSETVRVWISASQESSPTVGGFLYVTLASLAMGLGISAIRWALIDGLFHRTGIRAPDLDFSNLPERLEAFEGLVENHYRYYQFYSNGLVAVLFAYSQRLLSIEAWTRSESTFLTGFIVAVVTLFLGSRDTLRKYYDRTTDLLGIKVAKGARGR